MHTPVLSKEILEILNPQSGEFVVDGTFGSGGHACAFIEHVKPNGSFLGIDWSPEAVVRGKNICDKTSLKKCFIRNGNYRELQSLLSEPHFPKPDIFFLDLGLSTEELEESGRGFSFKLDEPLDMRFNPSPERATAAELINRLPEKRISDILFEFGGERFAPRIARAVVEQRRVKRIIRTSELVDCIYSIMPKSQLHGRLHPATRTFQALRIFVNDELENISCVLKLLPNIMAKSGRVGIISFHSLEDRIVKNSFLEFSKKKIATLLMKKPICPNHQEITLNPKSRSAKFRAIRF